VKSEAWRCVGVGVGGAGVGGANAPSTGAARPNPNNSGWQPGESRSPHAPRPRRGRTG